MIRCWLTSLLVSRCVFLNDSLAQPELPEVMTRVLMIDSMARVPMPCCQPA